MATIAVPAEPSVVHVVDLVTAHAGRAGAHPRRHWTLVTSLALQPAVPAVERERRAPVMIEIPAFPGTRVVAILATRSETQLVLVVVAVTADACRGDVFKRRRQMALVASDLRVRAEQWKPRQTVIKQRTLPGTLVVAAIALPALLSLVLVVLFVARDANGLEFFAE